MENDRILALYVSPTSSGQPWEDEDRPPATMRMRGTVTNHCIHHPWIILSGKYHRDSYMQELYRKVRKPWTVTVFIQVILSGKYRRDSYMQELCRRVRKPRTVTVFIIQVILSGKYRKESYMQELYWRVRKQRTVTSKYPHSKQYSRQRGYNNKYGIFISKNNFKKLTCWLR